MILAKNEKTQEEMTEEEKRNERFVKGMLNRMNQKKYI